MGKPFDIEVDALPETYRWAVSQPIDRLARAIDRLQAHPLYAVGSGGSYSVCQFASHLHGVFSAKPAAALTPLQSRSSRTPIATSGIIVPTAGGNNPDVVGIVRHLAQQEPEALIILCGNSRSKVVAQATQYPIAECIAYDLPTGRDGFLATNSLLAFCVLLARAYCEASGHSFDLAKDFHSFLGKDSARSRPDKPHRKFVSLLERDTLVILYGPSTQSAAIDLESKFTESALGHVQICDFRQFAHGRHHWLAKRAEQSAILSLECIGDRTVASQTLATLPKTVTQMRLNIPYDGWRADIAAICEGMYIVQAAGHFRQIDPGRPGVPPFGRRLYHANAFRRISSKDSGCIWTARAIERKASETLERLASDGRLRFWRDSHDNVIARITSARFGGVVLDYDGTLCSEDGRFDPLPDSIVDCLSELLTSGFVVGVATGRGKSVRLRLRESINKKLWRGIIVGYYNGSEVMPLASEDQPDGADRVGEALRPLAEAIQSDPLLAQGKVTLRKHQITLERIQGLSLDALCEHAMALVNRTSPSAFRVMRSGHSVDVVSVHTSKLTVVERVQELSARGTEVLRIGDRGRWPGNDAQLLASPYGLSVHEVSSDSQSCWHLAPPGYRGWKATVWYFQHLAATPKGLRLRLPVKKRGSR